MAVSFKVINPYDKSQVGSFSFTSKEESEKALSLLKKKNFKRLPSIAYRSEVLERLEALLIKHKAEMAKKISQEMGKTISDANVELARASLTTKCAAQLIRAQKGELLLSDNFLVNSQKPSDRLALIQRAPLGIIAAITPFNFPINLALHKIAPGYAIGNAILLKPNPQCYFSTKMLVDLCYEAGFTENDIQLICPDIPDFSKLLESSDIRCVSFTGGIKAAEAISKISYLKKQIFELGGNDALIVFPDADIEKAAQTAIDQRFTCAGQRCTASKRIFIHKSRYQEFKNTLLEKSKNLKIGNPLEEATVVGPVVSEEAAKEIESRILQAKNEGATILLGGTRDHAIISPTILENVNPESKLVRDETFGPVLPLFSFENTDKVIEQVNSTEFGLQCGAFTNDFTLIKKLFLEIEVGGLIINDGPGYRADHFPFGGTKSSGLGREGIECTMEEMSELKTLVL